MNCVKCGREIPEDQVFCEVCLKEMENYPVKPGTAIHIPTRSPEEKHPQKPVKKKHILTMEELLLRTRKKLRRTRIFAVILLLICGVLCFLSAQAVLQLDFQRLLGQNYRTDENQASTKPVSGWKQLITRPTESKTEIPAPAEETQKPASVPAPLPEPAPAPTVPPTVPTTTPPTVPPTEVPAEPATQPPTEEPAPAPTEVPAEPTEPAPAATETPAEPAAPVETAPPAPAETVAESVAGATEVSAAE